LQILSGLAKPPADFDDALAKRGSHLAAFGFSALPAFSLASSPQMRGIQWRSRACLDLAQDSYGKRFGTEWDMEFHNGANRAFPPRV
jgi:hypothetical protein